MYKIDRGGGSKNCSLGIYPSLCCLLYVTLHSSNHYCIPYFRTTMHVSSLSGVQWLPWRFGRCWRFWEFWGWTFGRGNHHRSLLFRQWSWLNLRNCCLYNYTYMLVVRIVKLEVYIFETWYKQLICDLYFCTFPCLVFKINSLKGSIILNKE